jgi:hypothetical protein
VIIPVSADFCFSRAPGVNEGVNDFLLFIQMILLLLFFVGVFTDYFFVFSIHWIFHFRSDAARCKNRMHSCRVIFLLFSVRGGLIDSLFSNRCITEVCNRPITEFATGQLH